LLRAMREQLAKEAAPSQGIVIQGVGAITSQVRSDICPHCHLHFPADAGGVKLKFDASIHDSTRQAVFCPHCDLPLNLSEFVVSDKQ
ncbi:MAG: hypothetical protein L0312_27785, partial [Acidobacteria bacterium]|nr:hypothetical protein [Acidobacteriota bacterium]